MRFDCVQRRLERLEARLIDSAGPWPPAEGSFSYLLWDALGRPVERLGFMEMYLARAADFWEGRE